VLLPGDIDVFPNLCGSHVSLPVVLSTVRITRNRYIPVQGFCHLFSGPCIYKLTPPAAYPSFGAFLFSTNVHRLPFLRQYQPEDDFVSYRYLRTFFALAVLFFFPQPARPALFQLFVFSFVGPDFLDLFHSRGRQKRIMVLSPLPHVSFCFFPT